jgi:CRISPR-associated protein Cas6
MRFPIDSIGQPVDFLFPLLGDCVFAGYNYPLYAALKMLRFELFTDPEVGIGNISEVEPMRRGLLLITKRSRLRIRAPHYFASGLTDQCNRPIRVGSHIVKLGLPQLCPINPSSGLWAEFVAPKSLSFRHGDRQPTHREFLGWFADKLRRKLKATRAEIIVGRSRLMPMGDYPATKGYAVQIEGLSDDQSMQLQIDGIGGRRHMGGGMFIAGTMPKWLRADNTRFSTKRPTRCTTLAI